MPKTVDYTLKTGFKYHHKNDEVEAKFITLSSFSMKQMELVAPVREIATKALGRLAESVEISKDDIEAAKNKAGSNQEVDAAGLMAIIAMHCGDGDLARLYGHMKKLITSGVAYIDGSDVKLSGIHIDDLDPADFEMLCGNYIGNFITS